MPIRAVTHHQATTKHKPTRQEIVAVLNDVVSKWSEKNRAPHSLKGPPAPHPDKYPHFRVLDNTPGGQYAYLIKGNLYVKWENHSGVYSWYKLGRAPAF
jgi:hypothetical protein